MPSFISKAVSKGDYYFVDLTPSGKSPLSVVCGGRELCGPDYRVRRKGFRYHSIELVNAGQGSLTLNGRTQPLSAGSVFRYGPGIAHEIVAESAAPLDKYFVDFVGTQAAELVALAPWNTLEALHVPNLLRIQDLFKQLQNFGQRRSPHREEILGRLLQLIVLMVADEAVPVSTRESAAWLAYQSSRRYIDDYCLELHTLRDIAARCGYTHTYLCRLFRRFDTQTPYEYLMNQKMGKASVLLYQTDRLIREVGSAVGIEDPYLFSKMFKRVYGISPKDFRDRRRESQSESPAE